MVSTTSPFATSTSSDLDQLSINTIRFLAVDAVENANSGHPGMPMGAAPMAYVLWTRFLKHNPMNPKWFNRDRFVLSAGHGSMLLYSLLYLTGYALSLAEIRRFRRWESLAPGHPERNVTPGVEVTTGPLGQGFGNGVGMAIAEANLAARYNRPGLNLIDHFTYSIVSDGDLMEGVASEAASLAGHLRLGKLIYLYDQNLVSLSAATDLTFTEDTAKRFEAYGWHTLAIEDGNDLAAIDGALRAARAETSRPSLLLVRTHLGYGSPNKQDTFAAHGAPLGPEEVRLTKQHLGWPTEPPFYVPDEALQHFREAVEQGKRLEADWNSLLATYRQRYPELAEELEQAIRGDLPAGWDRDIPRFSATPKGIATRVAAGKVLEAIAARVPSLIGGSADLDPSTHTVLKEMGDFESPEVRPPDLQGAAGGDWSYAGRNLHFGVREHGMGTILNGLAAHGGTIPFGATFLVFSDYMRPPIRLAALQDLRVIYIFTHDSIALGEDGPTHQPVEQLLGLRSIPGLIVLRPADANETAASWRVAMEQRDRPVALVLSRQNLPVLELEQYPGIEQGVPKGAYILAEVPENAPGDLTLIATGSEVHLALASQKYLAGDGIMARVVSMPSWELFTRQSDEYRESVVPSTAPILAIEAGTSLGWRPYVGPHIGVIGVDRFGMSAPGPVVQREYGFQVATVCVQAHRLVDEKREAQHLAKS